MYRARIPLVAAAFVFGTMLAVLLIVRATLSGTAQSEVGKRVERAQATWPTLDLLRGIDLTNETAKLARDDEFGAIFDQKGDEQRQAAFVAISVRNQRLEGAGHKADIVAVVGGTGRVVARDLNINAMYDDDLKSRYPSVGKALDGVANKDVWNLDGHMYRVGAAPIRSRAGAIVGALLVGYVATATDAQSDRDKLGTEVAYFLDGKIHASSFRKEGGESAEEKALAQDLFDPASHLADGAIAGNLTPAQTLRIGNDEYVAAAGPLPGNLTHSKSGYVVLSSLTAARASHGTVMFFVFVLGLIGLLVAVGASVMTAMRFLRPLDQIETGVAEVINGNRDYSFDTPSKDFEGLANALNVMLARLLGRPDPSDDELGDSSEAAGAQRWGGELSVDASTTGPQTSPELLALAEEPEESYLRRTFDEYVAARKQTNEGTEGLTLDGFTQKLTQNEAALKKKYGARLVRFKVVVKNNQTTLKPFPIQ